MCWWRLGESGALVVVTPGWWRQGGGAYMVVVPEWWWCLGCAGARVW